MLKDWSNYIEKFNNLINQPFYLHHGGAKYNVLIIRIIKALTKLSLIQKRKNIFNVLDIKAEEFKVVDANKMNPENPKNEYILLKNIDESKGIVVDSGHIKQYDIKVALNLLVIKSENFQEYNFALKALQEAINYYCENTGNEFILDPLNFKNNI